MTDASAAHVRSGDVAGLVAVVARGDDVEWTVLGEQTIGGPPMQHDSLFRIASAGKPITAAAVLALVADGHIQLDDPVDDVLPELVSPRVLRSLTGPIDDTVTCRSPIRLRNLLRSTNGHGFPSDFSAPVVALLTEQLHQALRNRNTPHHPANGWQFSPLFRCFISRARRLRTTPRRPRRTR